MFLATLLSWVTLFAASTTINTTICQPAPSAPTITSPANNSSIKTQTITVSGTSSDHLYEIDIYDNGSHVATTTSDSSGKFGVSVNLVKHLNQLVARANNKCGAIANSSTVNVTFNGSTNGNSPGVTPVTTPSNSETSGAGSTTSNGQTSTPGNSSTGTPPTQSNASGPLKLELNGPLHFSTKQSSIYLQGSTNLPAKITIFDNGDEISTLNTAANGAFEALVPLKFGKNAVVVTATAGGHTTAVHVGITRLQSSTVSLNDFWTNHKRVIAVASAAIAGLMVIGLTVKLVSAKLLHR